MMRRYLFIFVTPTLIICGLSACLSFIFEPIDGDLTRIGSYAESDFGWNAPQPIIKVVENGKPISDPDVLVLGDSFSEDNLWQSVLSTKLDKKVLSFGYDHVGCVNNWIDYALNQPTAKTVVIEIVERAFLHRFGNQSTCNSVNVYPFKISASTTLATREKWPPELHILHTWQTALNTLEMHLKANATFRDKVVNAKIRSQCANFSNRQSDRILYYPADEEKLHWEPRYQTQAIANVLKIQNIFAKHGKNFILVIVPDKLSVYQNCLLDDGNLTAREQVNVTNALIAAGINTPDLLSSFKSNVPKIVDLYRPNNTHLSERGYILMAENLEQIFREKY